MANPRAVVQSSIWRKIMEADSSTSWRATIWSGLSWTSSQRTDTLISTCETIQREDDEQGPWSQPVSRAPQVHSRAVLRRHLRCCPIAARWHLLHFRKCHLCVQQHKSGRWPSNLLSTISLSHRGELPNLLSGHTPNSSFLHGLVITVNQLTLNMGWHASRNFFLLGGKYVSDQINGCA